MAKPGPSGSSWAGAGRARRARARNGCAVSRLANRILPRSPWAAANKDRPKAIAHAREMAEALIRTLAKSLHAEAQGNEKQNKVIDKERYTRAQEAYAFYLANFPDAADAIELRYLRADILYFKLGKVEEAGNEYIAVGRSKPPGQYHKDALLQAMSAFEKLRRPVGAGKREITDSDRKFAEAADLWFHCMVMLAYYGLRPEDVLVELERRAGTSGLEEKAARKARARDDG